MELVRDDGSVVELRERQRHELGRAAGKPRASSATSFSDLDTSVSRHHVILELLRPSSRKGKEVVGESPALKLYVQVIGRNPICIVRKGGSADGKDGEGVQLVRRGESDWLAPGDKFTLSIKKPAFLILRQCSCGSAGPHCREESLSALRNAGPAGMGANVVDDEEKGIAEAVARRTRRRVERDAKNQTNGVDEKKQDSNGTRGGEGDTMKTDSDGRDEEIERPPREPSNGLPAYDPVRDFGFVKEGSEFDIYEKHRNFKNASDWTYNIDKKGRDENDEGDDDEEPDNDEAVSEESGGETNEKRPNGTNAKAKRQPAEEDGDDEEWEGDSKEEVDRVSKAAGKTTKRKVSTRSSNPAQKSSTKRPPNAKSNSTGSRKPKTQDSGDLSDFVVSNDDESIEEDEDEEWDVDAEDADVLMEDDDENDLMDDDGPATRKTKRKPACKYGSTCYRKSREHLEQFSHPSK